MTTMQEQPVGCGTVREHDAHEWTAPGAHRYWCPGDALDVRIERPEMVEHPQHYGGEDDPYEAIKVIEAWKLGFGLGNCVKYIARAGKKGDLLLDLKKARWYLDRVITRFETRHQDDDEEFIRG